MKAKQTHYSCFIPKILAVCRKCWKCGNAVLALGLTPAPDRAEEFPMWEGHLAHSIGGEEEAFISPTLHNGNP